MTFKAIDGGCSQFTLLSTTAGLLVGEHGEEAMYALEHVGPKAEADMLKDVGHADVAALEHACQALRSIGLVKSIPVLEEQLKASNPRNARAAQEASDAIRQHSVKK